MATATFSITNSTLNDNNLFKTDFVCEIAGALPYQDCQMLLSYYSPSAQGDVSLDIVYGTADGEGNAVLSYKLDGNKDVGGEPLASIIFPSDGSTTSINCSALNSVEVIGFERFTLTLDAPPIFSEVTLSSNREDGLYIRFITRADVWAKIEPRFGASIESATLFLTNDIGDSTSLGMGYITSREKWTGHVNTNIHSGKALVSIQATDSRGGVYNYVVDEIIIMEHAYPSLTIDCFRCDSNGDLDMNGDHISVTAYANSVPLELGISSLKGRIYPYPGSEEPVVWTNLTNGVPTLFEEASLSPDGTITTDEIISPDKGYRVSVVASDGYYPTYKNIDIPPVNRIINVKDGGTGVAFGKLATEDGLLDSAWDINTDGEYLVQGQPLVDTLPGASTTERGLVQFPIALAQGGTGQTGQTAQQSYTPTVKIGTTTPTVSSLSAYYKSWGLMKLIGGRFNLTTTGTGQLIISLPTGFTVPTSAVQPMGILIASDQKAYHIRVAANGLAALSNSGSSVTWATGYYCFWAVVMGN